MQVERRLIIIKDQQMKLSYSNLMSVSVYNDDH
jgi:hypothetical protein